MIIYGVDFTSAPCARKPIVVAVGQSDGPQLLILDVKPLPSFASFEEFLDQKGPWVGGFDFPFGLSRAAVTDLGWPENWVQLLVYCKDLGRSEFKRLLDSYRESRPHGNRYAKRKGDVASGAHPSVKLVRPPVGFMFLEGAPRLAASGLHIPGLCAANCSRIALEAYPGLLVRKQLGIRDSYKSDEVAKHTEARKQVRKRILEQLMSGRPLGYRVKLTGDLESRALEDGSGDILDAVICAAQAHWGWLRRDANFGLPLDIDPIEGWIVSAERPVTS